MKKRIRRHVRKARYIIYKETLIDFKEHLWTFIGTFLGIGIIGLLNSTHRQYRLSQNSGTGIFLYIESGAYRSDHFIPGRYDLQQCYLTSQLSEE
jgi:hypothetical protein